MSGETQITIVGNTTSDPELRYTQNGLAVVNFTIASTPRHFDKNRNEWVDDESLFIRCSAWREFAEQIAGSLTKGMRVIAQGRLKQRSYEDRDGNKRTTIELELDEVGPSLKYATAQVTRTGGNANQQRNQNAVREQMRPGTAGQPADQWNAPGGQSADEPWSPQGGQRQGGQQGQDVWSDYSDDTPF
jgi:single-strand DNA-binding protein